MLFSWASYFVYGAIFVIVPQLVLGGQRVLVIWVLLSALAAWSGWFRLSYYADYSTLACINGLSAAIGTLLAWYSSNT
jgi:hypothetical protein